MLKSTSIKLIEEEFERIEGKQELFLIVIKDDSYSILKELLIKNKNNG